MFNFSKIHLNIINILNKYPDEDFYEDTSLSKKNINKSNDKIYKLRKSIINNRRDLDIKNNIISEINNHKRTSKNKKIQLNPIESDNLNNSMYKKFPNGKYFSLIEKDNSNINKYLRNFSLNQKKGSLPLKRRSVLFKYDKNNFKRKISNNKVEPQKNIYGQLSEFEIIKLNENIHNDLNYINLKKKISKLKKKLKLKYSHKNKEDKVIVLHPVKDKSMISENELNNKKLVNYNINKIKKSPIKKNIDNKYRYLKRNKNLYDSFDDDEEFQYEEIDYYISPNSVNIKIFDILLLMSSLFYFIVIPYILSKDYFIKNDNYFYKSILIIIDIIYIIDIIINFFRAYHKFDEHLIKNKKKIFAHYIKTWFIIDLIEAIPYFSLFQFYKCKFFTIEPFFYIIIFIKVIKLYKMFNNNSTIFSLSEFFSKSEIIDNNGSAIITISLFIFCLNFTACLFIFLANNSYPNWILKLNIQDKSYLNIYLTSIYFVIVTVTTVGYGDISGDSIPEIIFQIILLIVGTIAYSFIISFFSNYIIKINQKSMTFEKNFEIINEIKIKHPNMKNKLYKEILRNLHNEQLYEKKDKHLLLDCLPYSLKNKLIEEMYKPIIKTFLFFKDIDNSDFIVKVVTSLKPLIAIKNDIIIYEGEFIKEIIFVKNGLIDLNISIDLNNPELSIKKFYGKNEIGKFNISYIKLSEIKKNEQYLSGSSNIYPFLLSQDIDTNTSIENDDNIEYISIVKIRKNEYFGNALMFLNERCPFNGKIKSNKAELFTLRKMEAIEIYSIYPHIWKKINKKSLFIMEKIYNKMEKVVNEISYRYKKIENNKNFLKNNLIQINKNGNYGFNKNQKNKKCKKEINKKNKKIKNEKKNMNNKNKENKENKENKNIKNNQSIDKINDEIQNIPQRTSFSQTLSLYHKNLKIRRTLTKNSLNNKIIQKESNKSLFNKEKDKINENNSSNKFGYIKKTKTETNNNCALSPSIPNTNSINNINEDDDDDYFKPREINDEIKEDESFIGKNSISKKNSKQQIKLSLYSKKMDDLNILSFDKENLSPKIIINKNNNKFINLNSTKENSFLLNSSYENINQISNNKYINNIALQNKIKQIIKEDFIDNISYISSSKSPINNLNLKKNLSPSNALKFKNNNYNSIKIDLVSDIKNDNNICICETPKIKSSKALKKSMTKKSFHDIISENSKRTSSHNIRNNNNNIFSSFKKTNLKRISNICSPTRIRRKTTKHKSLVDKQLNTISKNIENANNVINNPNEFYLNLFTNLIRKKSKGNEEDDEEKEKEKEKKSENFIKILNDNLSP